MRLARFASMDKQTPNSVSTVSNPHLDEFIFGAEVRDQDILSVRDPCEGHAQSTRGQRVSVGRQVAVEPSA